MTTSTREYPYLQKLVMDRAAIVLSDSQEYLLESRLSRTARDLGLDSSAQLIDLVRRSGRRDLEDRIVESMTTNETLWFRDSVPFEALRERVIPDLVRRRSGTKKLAAWSAACSSGQELHSLALLLTESFPDLSSWDLELHGSDLSADMVRRAREGLYSSVEVERGLPASMLSRYFEPVGNRFFLRPEIRRLSRFEQMNLVGAWPEQPRYDLVLMRNVLIYFDVPTRRSILSSAARVLAPDGYLLLGASETLVGVTDTFEPHSVDGATFYRRRQDR